MDFWDAVEGLSFANLGFYIIALFMASWFVSVVVYKARRIDDLDVVSTAQAHAPERPSSLPL